MSFFSRIGNLWRGVLSLFIGGLEQDNPEAVYQAAIEERIARYGELKDAVAGILTLRNKLSGELEEQEAELQSVMEQLPVAVTEGEDEVALHLINKKDGLTARIQELKEELTKINAQAKDSQESLRAFQASIEKLKEEKLEMLAKKANAEALITIQDTLDGLSTEADVQALENVRESIHQLEAKAEIGEEMQDNALSTKLSEIEAKASSLSAQRQLDALKQELAPKEEAPVAQEESEGDAGDTVNKTM
jgi:phage shock protein A